MLKNIVVLWYEHYLIHWQWDIHSCNIKNSTNDRTKCCNKEKDSAAKCRTWSKVSQTLIASVGQSLCQKFATPVLIFDDNKVKLIRLLTQQHLLTVSVRYTQRICMVSSASLSRKVQNEWCSCNNHTFVCNFAKCWPVWKIVPPANRMTKFEIKWSLNKPLYLKCAALLPVDYQ